MNARQPPVVLIFQIAAITEAHDLHMNHSMRHTMTHTNAVPLQRSRYFAAASLLLSELPECSSVPCSSAYAYHELPETPPVAMWCLDMQHEIELSIKFPACLRSGTDPSDYLDVEQLGMPAW